MTEELQHTLSSLAESLGITVGELWSWLQGNGIDAYARAVTARLWVESGFEVLAIAILLISTVVLMKRNDKATEEYRYYDGEYMFAAITCIVIAAFVAYLLYLDMSELAGWLASPEGMVISTILGRR